MSDIDKLRASEHFDAEWYLTQYPDVAALGMDPAEHYLKYGRMLGRMSALSSKLQLISSNKSDPALLDLRYQDGVIPRTIPSRHPELVSILMPSYNNEKWLSRAINSALSQQGVQVEVILIDDGSTDGSVQLARQIAQNEPDLKVISLLRNFGCYYARNIGLMHATGEFVTVLDSDDIQPLDGIARQLDAIKKVPGAMACRGQNRRWTEDFTTPVSEMKHGEANLLWRREIMERIGFYDSVRYSGDAEFRLRFQRAYGIDALVKISDEIYFARTSSDSLTVNKDSGVFKYSEGKISVAISPPRKAYASNFTSWQKQKKPNLNISFPQFSRPFDLGANDQNASPTLGHRCIGTMASFPPRRESLKAVVDRILPQLDELRIYLNDYDDVPDFLVDSRISVTLSKNAEGDLRDNGKFYDLRSDENVYFFSLDDDLAYPTDYVARMVHWIEVLGRSSVVGVHGIVFPSSDFKSLQQRKVLHFKEKQKGQFVDLLGTGTTAWHSSTFKPDLTEFLSKGMCDLWFASATAKQHIPMFSIPRSKNWLQEHAKHDFGLFTEALEKPDEYFKIYGEVVEPALKKGQVRRDAIEHLMRCYDVDTLAAAGIATPEKPAPKTDLQTSTRRIATCVDPLPSIARNILASADPERLHFEIVVTGWNCREYLAPCVRSIAQQLPANYSFNVTLIDDESTDGTYEELLRTSLLPQAKLIRISQNTGPAHARHVGISAIEDPETIVVLLDMDDALEPNALRTVAKRYRDNPNCLMTIGNWHDQDGKKNPQGFYTAEEIDNQSIRKLDLFNATHLRTFRRHLYNAIEVADLLDRAGKWLETCTDVALMYPLLDQCRSHEVEFIDEPIYRYTRKHSAGTLARFGKPHKTERLGWLKSMARKERPHARLSSSSIIENNNRIINTAPTVIFGNPRSGTRMCANVLHNHPDICVTDEALALPRMIDAVNYACDHFLSKYQSDTQLQRRREILAKTLWITRSTNGVLNRLGAASYLVNKTSRLEHRFDELEALFQTTPPRYVYCVRNAFGVLKSIKNLPNLAWNANTVEANLEHYLASLRQYEKIVRAAPERTVMINLDELKDMPSNFTMYEKVFDLMDIPAVHKDIQNKINKLGAQNSMALVHKKNNLRADIQNLTSEEVRIISQNEEYQKFARQFNLLVEPS